MKFFDPKKKEPSVPENPVSTPRPANIQNVNTVPKTQPVAPPPAPVPEPPRPELFKHEAVRMEPKTEAARPQAGPLAGSVPVPEPVKAVRTGKTLIGNSVVIRGEITSDENLQIEGAVDGSIESNSDIHVGTEGRVNANIRAVNIVIHGRVIGDCTASNKLELAPAALLQGNIRAPKLSIAETALFKGSIDMRPRENPVVREPKEKTEPKVSLETVEK
jgi:cytoskeletal protein CcmA (bactofilin family)